MGYNLWIGEAIVIECLKKRRAWVGCETVCLDEAPINSSDEKSNYIYPSYSAFADFCRTVGIYDIFYISQEYKKSPWWTDPNGEGHDCLLGSHPGAAPLTEDHYNAFKEARERYMANRKENDEYIVKRLDWLIWWTRWALDNCKYPTFANT